MKTLSYIFTAIVVILLFVIGGGYLPHGVPWLKEVSNHLDLRARISGQARAAADSERYETAPVERGDVRQIVTATGTLNALETVEVGTQLSGQIAHLFADFNDEVTKGQRLAQLDRRSYEAKVAELKAATEKAEALVSVQRVLVERARVAVRDAEAQRAVLQARLDFAKVKVKAAQVILQRAEALEERGAGSAAKVDDAHAELDAVAASMREAEALAAAHDHTLAGAKVDLARAEAELVSTLASVPERKALQQAAEIELERTTIRSPLDGVIIGRSFDEGQTVATGLEVPTLFTIAGDLSRMEIHANVDETDIGKVKVRQTASFSVDAYPGRRFSAVVNSVHKAPALQNKTAEAVNVVTYTVVLATSNEESLLLPGMTAVVRITASESISVLNVPVAALRFSPAGGAVPNELLAGNTRKGTVWRVADDGRLTPVAVEIGAVDDLHAEILNGGLNEADRIVVAEAHNAAPRELFGIRWGF